MKVEKHAKILFAEAIKKGPTKSAERKHGIYAHTSAE